MEKLVTTLKCVWTVVSKLAAFASRYEEVIVAQADVAVSVAEKRAAEFTASMKDEQEREKVEKTGAKVVSFVRVTAETIKTVVTGLAMINGFTQLFA